MSLIKVNELLQHATEHHYGVPAINVINTETIRYAIQAAENEHMPIIIQYWPGFDDHCALDIIAFAARYYAERASVPVAVHQDHSAGFEIAVKGIKAGFPSVMVDGSSLPYEENFKLTHDVVEVAKIFGVDIEAELGHVGDGGNADDFVKSDMYTDPNQAEEFVRGTGCASLAIAVGNAHGPYIKVPDLDMQRIKDCRAAVSVPLVMHGCSDIPDEQLQEAVNLGMSKFNIATEYFRSMYRAFEKDIASGEHDGNGVALLMDAADDMRAFVSSKIQLLNPNHYSL